jgi:hypothetical protein
MEHLLLANISGTLKTVFLSQFMFLVNEKPGHIMQTLSDSKLRLLNNLLWLMGNIFMD